MSLSPQKVDFQSVWERLADGVSKLITLSNVKGMPLYEDIYKLCTAQPQPYSEQLYFHLKKHLEDHVEKIKQNVLSHQSDILAEYIKAWSSYSIGSQYCNIVFRYLNQYWIKKRREEAENKLGGHLYQGPASATEVYEINILALHIWKEHIFEEVKDCLTKRILELIRKERDGEQINQKQITDVIQSFIKLGTIKPSKPLEIYREGFEIPYINETREYYARESTLFIAQNGVSAYMKKAETRISEEELRAKQYLDTSSLEKVRKEIDTVLIERHKEMIQAECETMLKEGRQEDLNRMYRLLTRISNGIEPMRDILQNYATRTGLEAIKSIQIIADNDNNSGAGDTTSNKNKYTRNDMSHVALGANVSVNTNANTNPNTNTNFSISKVKRTTFAQTYVECLLNVYHRFNELVRHAFKNDPAFVSVMDTAYRKIINENIINKNTMRSSELLALYSDMLLRRSTKHSNENELDTKLQQIHLIFKYLDDKDVFEKFYCKGLARRLIHKASVGDDAEKFMISGFKAICGYEYTSKMQRMFDDIQVSNDLNDKFRQHCAELNRNLGVDFSVLVLAQGSWPLQTQPSNFSVPAELEKLMEEFLRFYKQLHDGRKLCWLHYLSKGDIKVLYTVKKYELQATSYQIGILLLFNECESYTTDELAASTNLSDIELKRTLQSLIDCKLLIKSPSGDTINPSDTFTLNANFQSKKVRFKIISALQADTPQQITETKKFVDDDRQLYLQAAIVRIMKTRKTLSHNNLVKEVFEQARPRFIPNIALIKKCIEQLIEKEYLERVDNDKYNYLA